VTDIRSLIERVDARITIRRQHQKAEEMGAKLQRPLTYIVGPGGIKIRPT